MRLPKAIHYNGNVYTDIEVTVPNGVTLAETQELANNGDIYTAMQSFILGCVRSITGPDVVDEKKTLREMIRLLPYRSAEYVAIQIMLLVDGRDEIEGIYPCPRCGTQYVSELKDEIDTRDHISDLEVVVDENNVNEINYDVQSEVTIKTGKGELIESISAISFRVPTLGDCILSSKQTGMVSGVRFQITLYKNCLLTVNKKDVSPKFRAEWGSFLFDHMLQKDLEGIFSLVTEYGQKTSLERHCLKCKKAWKAEVNTTNFFVSGLRSS